MIKTIYGCEKCKKEWEPGNGETLCTVGVAVNFGGTSISDHHFSKTQHWCRTCVMKYGIHKPITDKDKRVAPEPLSFEEKFTELLIDMGFVQE